MTLVGTSGLGFASGWPGIWEQIFVPLSAAFCIIFFGSKLNMIGRKHGCMTLEDYFDVRYENNKKLRVLAALASIAVSLVYLVGQYTAISIVLIWAFGIEHWQALLIAGVIITAYTVIGGLYAVSWTALVQGLILIFGVILVAPFILSYAGGLEHINLVLSTIDPNLVMPWFPSGSTAAYAYFTPEYLLSFGILLMVGLACAPHVMSNVLSARKISYFKWAPLVAFAIYLVIMFLVKLCGMAVRSMQADGLLAGIVPSGDSAADFALMYGIQASSPTILITGLFAVIVLSAVMSTTDRLMLTVGTTFSWDIFKTLIKPKATERQVIRVSQISVLLAAVISLILAINPPEMLAFLIWLGIGMMLCAFAVPLISGLYWRRATAQGAIASMLVGLITCLGFGAYYNFVEKLPMHFSIYALICSIIAMVVVSLLTKKNSDSALNKTYTGLYLHPRNEHLIMAEETKE
jgi:SSS family solute:Na+ symporter